MNEGQKSYELAVGMLKNGRIEYYNLLSNLIEPKNECLSMGQASVLDSTWSSFN